MVVGERPSSRVTKSRNTVLWTAAPNTPTVAATVSASRSGVRTSSRTPSPISARILRCCARLGSASDTPTPRSDSAESTYDTASTTIALGALAIRLDQLVLADHRRQHRDRGDREDEAQRGRGEGHQVELRERQGAEKR